MPYHSNPYQEHLIKCPSCNQVVCIMLKISLLSKFLGDNSTIMLHPTIEIYKVLTMKERVIDAL